MKSVSVKSYAKINLYLDALYKRKDGFTEIRTVFSEIDFYDTVNFALTKNGHVKLLTSNMDLIAEKNLIYKIANFVRNKYNVNLGVEIELVKRIPVAAGLGGGSSNAACTLLTLKELWNLDISDKEMNEILAGFGSDLNFFLKGGVAAGSGRGEIITPVEIDPIENILLVNPGFPVLSGDAYKAVSEYGETKNWSMFLETGNPEYSFNALEKGVCFKYPEIKEILNALDKCGAIKSMLSGSGATVIGFFPDLNTAKEAELLFKRKKYWTYITRTKKR